MDSKIVSGIKPSKSQKGKMAVYINGEYAFSLIEEDIDYFKMKEGTEIPKEKYDFIIDSVIYIKAQDEALKYISSKMRTEKEVRKKLVSKEFDEAVLERVIEFLKKYNYLNDYEYSMAFIRQSMRLNPIGKIAIYRLPILYL